MKHLRPFDLLEKEEFFTAEQKDFLSEFAGKRWRYNPTTGLVDVKGNLSIRRRDKSKEIIPLQDFAGIKFGDVELDFGCSINNLTSLEGSPQKVGRNVNVSFLPLVGSLKGGPQEVGNSYQCNNCRLKSLEGAPARVPGRFVSTQNLLTSLEGSPKWIGGDFWLYGNELVSLKGAPKYVGRTFWCDAFTIKNGGWGIYGWLEVLEGKGVWAGRNKEAKKLILTVLDADSINEEMGKNPEKILFKLKGIWNDPEFAQTKREIIIPDRYKEDINTLGDLNDLGF
jgi:hypothetical protein